MIEPAVGAHLAALLYQRLRQPVAVDRAIEMLDQATGWTAWFQTESDPDATLRTLLTWIAVLPEPVRDRAIEAAVFVAGPLRRDAEDLAQLLQRIESRDRSLPQ